MSAWASFELTYCAPFQSYKILVARGQAKSSHVVRLLNLARSCLHACLPELCTDVTAAKTGLTRVIGSRGMEKRRGLTCPVLSSILAALSAACLTDIIYENRVKLV